MSAYNYRTRGNPVVFVMPPSEYRGKFVKILRSKTTGAVGCIGRVTIHNSETNVLCVVTDDWREFWTHVNNVELQNETEKK